MSRRLFLTSLALATATHQTAALKGNVFSKVVEKLRTVLSNAEEAHTSNADLFKREECALKDEIKQFKHDIPINKQIIEESTANMNAMGSKNEKLSVESQNLDREIEFLEAEMKRKTDDRRVENEEYAAEKASLEDAEMKLGLAIKQVEGGSGQGALMQVSRSLSRLSHTHSHDLSLLQTAAKTKTSGQVLGILKQLKDTMVSDLELNASEETKAVFYFNEFVKRSDATLKANKAATKMKKKQVKENTRSWNNSSKAKKENERQLEENTTGLETGESNLSKHREYFKQLSDENASLVATLQDAILLLTSDAVEKVGKNAEWSGPSSFVQIASYSSRVRRNNGNRATFLTKAVKQDYNTYGWDLISKAVSEIKESVVADKVALQERFNLCEQQLKEHHNTYTELKLGQAEKTLEQETCEINIAKLDESITNDKSIVSQKTEDNKTDAGLIKSKTEEVAKETAEAAEADVVFAKAAEILGKFEKGTVVAEKIEGEKSEGNYQSNQSSNSNVDKIIEIINHAKEELLTEVQATKEASEQQISDWTAASTTRTAEIKELKDAIASSLLDLENEKAILAGTKTYLENNAEALNLEGLWWGPAPGHKSPADGESCIEFLGRYDLAGEERHEEKFRKTLKNDKLQEAEAAGANTGASGSGGGVYHAKMKESTDEHASLEALEKQIEAIRVGYVGPNALTPP